MIEQLKQSENLLTEEVRQQYLKLMGIQTWFDPQLIMPDAVVAEEENNTKEVLPTEVQFESTPVEHIIENPPDDAAVETLNSLALKIAQCELCELHIKRNQAISGEGNRDAKIFIIIDAPILDNESEHSLLSVANKQMLNAMLQAIGFSLSSVFITSLVKCRPAENHAPQTSQMLCCDEHLSTQLKIIQPDVLMVLGEKASQHLLVSQKSLTDLRLRDHKHLGIPVYASYHPENLFNSSETKRKVWADLLQIKQHIK